MSSFATASALTGLKASQESIDIIGLNLANVNTENYIKKEAILIPQITDGRGTGVMVSKVIPKYNEFLNEMLRIQNKEYGSSQVINEYLRKVTDLMGSPNGSNNLNYMMNDFFNSMTSLQNSPTSAAMRKNAITASKNLVNLINNFSYSIQKIRYESDKDMEITKNDINSSIKKISELDSFMSKYPEGSLARASIEEERINYINKLSTLININVGKRNTGETIISTSEGLSLLDDSSYVLDYSKVNSEQELIENVRIQDLTVSPIYSSGQRGSPVNLITGGYEKEVTSILKGGRLQGLHLVRDVHLVNIAAQLDNLAFEIASSINDIHNSGAGYIPDTELMGKRELSPNDLRDWVGKARIGVVDNEGASVFHYHDPLNPNRIVRPLDLNFEKIDIGSGGGKLLTHKAIINEINDHFFQAPISSRVQMGYIENIKLVSRQDTTTAGGTFSFNFEFDNAYDQDYKVEILDISVNNGSSGLASALPASENIYAGKKERTTNLNTVNLDGGGGEYTITTMIKITDEDGVVNISNVTFRVSDNHTDFINKRLSPYSASGDHTIPGTKGAKHISPYTSQQYLKAIWVGENGEETDYTNPGYMKIKSMQVIDSSKYYHLAIDDLDSEERGNTNITGTNYGFSHFYRLNNLFEEVDEVRSSGVKLKLNSKIEKDPNLLALGKLQNIHPSGEDVSMTKGSAKSGMRIHFSGGFPAAGDTMNVNGTSFTFVAGAPADNQIDMSGGTWSSVMNSIVTQLSASNTTTKNRVELARYYQDPTLENQLIIEFKTAGSIGNGFNMSLNLTNPASINGLPATLTPSANLSGGADNSATLVKRNLYKFGVGRTDSSTTRAILALKTIQIEFGETSTTPFQTATISDYLNNFIDYVSNTGNLANNQYISDQTRRKDFQDQVRIGSEVLIDEQIANLMKFQKSYAASAKVISEVNKMTETLLNAF